MKLIIDIDDNDYELINKTGIEIDWNTAWNNKEKDRKMTFAIFDLVKALKNGTIYNPTAEITEKQAILLLINSGWLVNHDKELRERWERPQGEWIPIKTRPMNDEEKKKTNEYFGVPYEDLEWPDAWHYDCQLPEVKDGECVDVLVTTKEGYVVVTSYSKDCFGSASFENVEYPDDITAWAYMPEPYEKEGESDADS